ncbi:MAG TPA: hypothetical protein VH138_10760, partial [Vicinamibacterales bacterium]|nr:hypothetical protein [Vicinamibacterales bacterium]
ADAQLEQTAFVRARAQVHAHREETGFDEIVVPVVLLAAGGREAVDEAAETRDLLTPGDAFDEVKYRVVVEDELEEPGERVGHHAEIARGRIDARMRLLDEFGACEPFLNIPQKVGMQNPREPDPVMFVEVRPQPRNLRVCRADERSGASDLQHHATSEAVSAA